MIVYVCPWRLQENSRIKQIKIKSELENVKNLIGLCIDSQRQAVPAAILWPLKTKEALDAAEESIVDQSTFEREVCVNFANCLFNFF
jgi:hypothetical protein